MPPHNTDDVRIRELKDVEYEAVRAGHGIAAEDVHAERRQHAGNVREKKRFIEGDNRELPRRPLLLEP